MLSREIQEQGKKVILVRFKERQEILKEVIEQIKHEAEVKGILQSKVVGTNLFQSPFFQRGICSFVQ